MPKYLVLVSQAVAMTAWVEVEAASIEQAEELALEAPANWEEEEVLDGPIVLRVEQTSRRKENGNRS